MNSIQWFGLVLLLFGIIRTVITIKETRNLKPGEETSHWYHEDMRGIFSSLFGLIGKKSFGHKVGDLLYITFYGVGISLIGIFLIIYYR